MAGTKTGGKKAATTNRRKYGREFYASIGAKGGRNGHTGGFATETVGADGLTGPERAKIAGAKGGKKSKRGPAKNPTTKGLSAGYIAGRKTRITE